MKPKLEELLKEALELPPIERATIVDRLITSLDRPDDAIDKAWRKEIGDRVRAYKSGMISTISAEDILAEYRAK
ncbi:MAG: addiction module protein [Sedimentisphaerales bacterium]|nr:addiction module protein [Sedimentisphaerales bacterium]